MDITTWLDQERGRAAAVARRAGVAPAAVAQWKTGRVPIEHVRLVFEMSAGAVSLEEMLPAPTPLPAQTV